MIDAFNSTSIFVPGRFCSISMKFIKQMVHIIFPAELQLKDLNSTVAKRGSANSSDTEAAFLDMDISIRNSRFVNFRFRDGHVPLTCM